MEWLNNPWVVGIFGGIMSGALVTFLSRKVFSGRDNAEYARNVSLANREVKQALEPGISEGVVPSRSVVGSLARSTARKYNVDLNDTHGPAELAEELIKEVMDSSFISAKSKSDYCEMLDKLKAPDSDEISAEIRRYSQSVESLSAVRTRYTSLASVMLGMVAATTTVFLAFIERADTLAFSSEIQILFPTVIAATAALVASYAVLLRNRIRRRNDNDDEDE